jgi:hypothetical protein
LVLCACTTEAALSATIAVVIIRNFRVISFVS